MSYEYKVVPAPVRGLKGKGVRSTEDRFANALETAMNELAADGWEYIRADTLPCEQREGLVGKTTVFQNMLVFRRAKLADTAPAPELRKEPTFAAAPPPESVEDAIDEEHGSETKDTNPRPSPDVAAE
ncbi:DUF4177 domain-containing protein [Loktanella agnita]|uniref:DUF4177 domain-containing protein n=1 Tax=Loktanella agnita TaxID=287097 RepID=UPI00398693B6